MFIHLNELADRGYPFPSLEGGVSYRGSLRGADYLRFMRRLLRKADVKVLDKSPALELLMSDGVVVGAAGTNRVSHECWTVRSGAVVVATGGARSAAMRWEPMASLEMVICCPLEAGAVFSGMESFTGQYGICSGFFGASPRVSSISGRPSRMPTVTCWNAKATVRLRSRAT